MPTKHPKTLRTTLILILTLALTVGNCMAQSNALRGTDASADSSYVLEGDMRVVRSVGIAEMTHSPHIATMYAAICPGLGQIYNKKYWKLPIVYGGIAALCYSIHFNSKYYDKYRRAYRDFIIRDPNNKSYADVIKNSNITLEEVETVHAEWFTRALRNKKDYYRRYRDMSYFGLVGVYLLQIIDANVDAHFFNFDVDDNLSIRWQPTIDPKNDGSTMGASVTLTF